VTCGSQGKPGNLNEKLFRGLGMGAHGFDSKGDWWSVRPIAAQENTKRYCLDNLLFIPCFGISLGATTLHATLP